MSELKNYFELTNDEKRVGMDRKKSIEGKHRSHKLSHEVFGFILSKLPGRGGRGREKHNVGNAIAFALNDPLNLRNKSEETNLSLDRDYDNSIMKAFESRVSLINLDVARRARQAYKGGCLVSRKYPEVKVIKQVTDAIGEITYNDSLSGRPIKIKNLNP